MSTPPGWRPDLYSSTLIAGRCVARVVDQSKHYYWVDSGYGPTQAKIAGRLLYHMAAESDLPVVGDWVIIEPFTPPFHRIQSLLPRYSKVSRKVVGKRQAEDVLVSNIDQLLVVHGADDTFNIRRLERFVALAKETGVATAIMLSKIDRTDRLSELLHTIRSACPDTPLFPTSLVTHEGVAALTDWFKPHHTSVMLGPSGVGKTTLMNALSHQAMPVSSVNAKHHKGVHTTTRRQLFQLAHAPAFLIDTPGIREIQVWDIGLGLDDAFSDIFDLAQRCQFGNCTHDSEPGCAVKDAIQTGQLAPDRLVHYQKLRTEQAAIHRRAHGQSNPRSSHRFLDKQKKGSNQSR